MLFAVTSVLTLSISSWICVRGLDVPDAAPCPPSIRSAGPLAFGEGGVLFIVDSIGSAIYAVDTSDVKRMETPASDCGVEIDKRIESIFNVSTEHILINNMAVNPLSGNAYVSVSILREKRIVPAVVRVAPSGRVTSVPLSEAVLVKTVRRRPGQRAETASGGLAQTQATLAPLLFKSSR